MDGPRLSIVDNPVTSSDDSKAALRSKLRSDFAAMDGAARRAASDAVCERLAKFAPVAKADVVMLYMPLASEVDVVPFGRRFIAAGGHLVVPRTDAATKTIHPVGVASLDDEAMAIDSMGVRTPIRSWEVAHDRIDAVLVPGLAFDRAGRRLGRGGGFYDRFLLRLPAATLTIGVAYDGQIVDQVPFDPHDRRVDVVVTPSATTYTGARRLGGERRS